MSATEAVETSQVEQTSSTATTRAAVLARAVAGPEGHPRLGPRLRRERRPPRRPRVGRARGDAVARDPGGRQDRPLRLRGHRPVLRRPDRPARCRSSTRSCSGATPASAWRSWAPASPSPRSSARARPSRWASGSRSATAPSTSPRSPRSAPPSPTPAPTSPPSAPPPSTTRPSDEWVINGQKAWATNGGIANVHVVIASVDRELGSRGHAAFVIPPGHARAASRAPRSRSTACAPRTPPTSTSTTAASPARCLLGGKEKLDERLARVREGKKVKSQAAMQTFEATRPIVGSQADRHRPRRLRVRARLRQGARPVRQADHREPGDRLHARQHEDRDRRRPPARLARLVDGQDRPDASRTPRARCPSSRPARSPSG